MDELSDAELVGVAIGGDPTGFETIMRRHYVAVWRVALVSTRDAGAAEEVAQDAFLRASRSLGQWRGDAPLRSWLAAICRRCCIDRARLRRPGLVPLDEVEAVDGAEPPTLSLDLRAAIDALPDDEREALLVVHLLGFSSIEAAEILAVPASTLRSRIGRAKGRLAAALCDDARGRSRAD